MSIEREIPESHVTSLADQFADTAELLFDAIPYPAAPQALRVNAVFAVELYLKSLNSRWVRHSQAGSLGVDAITVESEARGHKLDKLFDALDANAREHLANAFAGNLLAGKYRDLRTMLAAYSDTFMSDRYIFERLKDEQSRPIAETVELARFFRNAMNSIERVRF